MRRSVLTKVAGLGLAVLALVAPAGASAAPAPTGGVGFRVDQTPGSNLVDGFIPIDGSPGQTIQGHFLITNSQTTGVSMTVYAADGLTGATTGVVYSDAGDDITGAGAWVTPDRTGATVGPRSEQLVNFSVRIPANATPGDHVAGVVLEQRKPGSTSTGAISQVVRNVVPIMIEVPGAAAPQIDVRSASITTLPGSQLLAITVVLRNEGLKLCRPQLKVALGSTGDTGGQVIRQLDTILPGDRAPYPMPWPSKLSSGSYLVHVTALGCGATDDLDVTLQTPRSQEESTPKTTPSTTPKVVTNATPGTETYTAGNGKKSGSGGNGKDDKKTSLAGVTGAAVIGGINASGGGGGGNGSGGANAGGTGHGAGAGNGAKSGKSLLPKIAAAVAKHAPDIAERATIPLSFLLLIGLLFFAQEAFDRRDPKLALAPLHREQDLPFDGDPLGVGRLIPSPTDLSPGTS
ncbi:MAG: hypothetical protein AAGC46_05985 [Solirubrobacteraceae bacterium]